MPSVYPSNLDNLSNPISTDKQSVVSHSSQHANANDAIENIEASLGILPQGSYGSVRLRLEAIEANVAALGSAIVASLLDNSVAGTKIQDGTLSTAKLADNSITTAKIVSQAVDSARIKDLAVATSKLADDAVTYAKVGNSVKLVATRAANQAIGGTTSAYISWDTKVTDTDGMVSSFPGSTPTVPTGKGGVYLIVAQINGFLSAANDYLQIEVSTGSVVFKHTPGGAGGHAVAVADVAAGGTIRVLVNNGSASSINATGRIYAIKLFDV